MRKWASLAVALAALVAPAAGNADHHTPAAVYSDFAADGVLTCGHPRSALKAVLNDASIYQYGDPLTFIGLKLAIRDRLAGGCRRRSERVLSFFAAPQSGDSRSTTTESPSSAKSSRRKTTSGGGARSGKAAAPPLTAGAATDGRRDGRMVLLGVGLLLVVLGAGGWAARRAFTTDP
jgi:hypothetical protein